MLKNFKCSRFPDDFVQSFNALPDDKYLQNEPYIFRKRRYSGCIWNKKAAVWQTQKSFVQAYDYNTYVGEVKRDFEAIEPDVRKHLEAAIIPKVVRRLPKREAYDVGVHQIRVCANEQHMGKPAPEGIHQDGFEFVAIVCVNKQNVAGGVSLVFENSNRDNVLSETFLDVREGMVFDDQKYAHYVSPIVPKRPGEAYRDIVVLTFD